MDRPRLPLVPRLINRVGAAASAIGIRPVSLAPESLIEAAGREAGLPSTALPAETRDGLERLVASLEAEAKLSLLGRFIARTDLTRLLANRLQLEDWHARHPEIGEQPITRPIFIVGQGRTGTTILHELLALDPTNRVPLTWEVDAPFPPPETATYRTDPRIAQSQEQLDRSESLIPIFKRMHRMGADLPQECVRITATDMKSAIFPAQWRVPSYTRWLLDEASMASAYAMHRRFLQLLSWRCPGERWIVKSPGHLWCLDAVLDEYPDALFVQTHRDPISIVSSLTSLETVLRSMCSDAIDSREIGREWSDWLQRAYDRSVDFRESGRLPAERIIDVHFDRFVSDPVASVHEIYDRFGIALTPEFEQAMRDYIDANPSDRDGKHRHTFAGTGLDLEQEQARLKRYGDYFDCPARAPRA